jgi:PAS domain S-box-containing protein
MNQQLEGILLRALKREKGARKAAEKILEGKSTEFYDLTQKLKKSNFKLEKLIAEKSSELRGVFENIVDAYVVMDLRGNVIKMNEPATSLLGYDNNQENINLFTLVDVSEVEKVKKSYSKLINNGSITNFQVKINTKSNDQKLVHINASIIYDENHKAIAAQGIVRDITEIKNLELQKEKLLLKLGKSNDELQEYAHIVSHDLKSPLSSIYALVSWLKEDNIGKFDKNSLQNFGHIESTLEKMELLISDVLLYSSVSLDESKKLNVDLNIVIEDLKKIIFIPSHIKINVKNKLPVVFGERTKFQQLFQNLIGNAIKFNNKKNGLIEIDVSEKKSFYQFSIKDNGVGIEKKYHDKIFKIFHSLNDHKDSTGIGLSIVKKIIDLYNGNIWIESDYGKGTTFHFTLKK